MKRAPSEKSRSCYRDKQMVICFLRDSRNASHGDDDFFSRVPLSDIAESPRAYPRRTPGTHDELLIGRPPDPRLEEQPWDSSITTMAGASPIGCG